MPNVKYIPPACIGLVVTYIRLIVTRIRLVVTCIGLVKTRVGSVMHHNTPYAIWWNIGFSVHHFLVKLGTLQLIRVQN